MWHTLTHIFWEGHKVLWNLHRRFVLYSASQINSVDFAKFLLWEGHKIWKEFPFFLNNLVCIVKTKLDIFIMFLRPSKNIWIVNILKQFKPKIQSKTDSYYQAPMIKLQCPYIKCFLKKLPFITMKPCLRPQQPVEVLVLLLMKVTIIPSRNLNLLSLVRFTKCPGHLESCKVCLPYFWRCWKLHMDLELNVPINDSTILRVRISTYFFNLYW